MPVNKLISHQQTKISRLSNGAMVVKSLQNTGEPGGFILRNAEKGYTYHLKFKGYKVAKERAVDIWIGDSKRNTLKVWKNVVKKQMTSLELKYNNADHTKLTIGVSFNSPDWADSMVIVNMDLVKGDKIVVKPKPTMTEGHQKNIQNLPFEMDHKVKIEPEVTKLAIIIYTYDRYTLLKGLLDNIKHNYLKTNYILDVYIFDDASPKKQIFQKKNYPYTIYYHRFPQNHGRYRWYKMIDFIYKTFKNKKYNYYICTSDDMVFVDNGLQKAIHIYDSIKDPGKVCVNINNDRPAYSKWNKHKHPKGYNRHVNKVYWVDMCFICEHKYFMCLDFQIDNKLFYSLIDHKRHSSGVGRYISVVLHRRGYNMYYVKKSLVRHLGNKNSKMNPKERTLHPLNSKL